MNIQSMTVSTPFPAPSCPVRHSPLLGRILSAVAPSVMALLDCQTRPQMVTGFSLPDRSAATALSAALQKRGLAAGTAESLSERPASRQPATEAPPRGPLARIEPLPPLALPRPELDRLLPATPEAGGWHGFRCRFECGATDLVLVHLPVARPHARPVGALLRMVWPALRAESGAEAGLGDQFGDEDGQDSDQSDEALLWLMRSRIDIGALVVNAQGLILRMNSTARRMVAEGRILARGHGGLHACCPEQTRHLREIIKACARSPAGQDESILFLRPADGGAAVPVTLARYVHRGTPTELVTLLLPEPPEPARVERIARELGLTAAEARVAAMLQTGLSNRSAATSLGLTEQTFATYAKRVLGKLNVSSRAEMAQMLTWQTHGGTEP